MGAVLQDPEELSMGDSGGTCSNYSHDQNPIVILGCLSFRKTEILNNWEGTTELFV